MADIELVIKIDEKQYKFIKQRMTIDKVKDYDVLLFDICEQISNGTPLPKDYKDRQDLINKSWQELINYKKGIEKIKMRSQSYRERGETILASGMEQALDVLKEVNAYGDSN